MAQTWFPGFNQLFYATYENLKGRLPQSRFLRIERLLAPLPRRVPRIRLAVERIEQSKNITPWVDVVIGKEMNMDQLSQALWDSQRQWLNEQQQKGISGFEAINLPLDEYRSDLDQLYENARALCDEVVQLVTNAVRGKQVLSLNDFEKLMQTSKEAMQQTATFYDANSDDLVWLATTLKVYRDKAVTHMQTNLTSAMSDGNEQLERRVTLKIPDQDRDLAKPRALQQRNSAAQYIQELDPEEEDPVKISSVISQHLHQLPYALRGPAIDFVARTALTSAYPSDILPRVARLITNALDWVSENAA